VAQYVGILDGSEDVWGVRIPDVPGCHGGGGTPEAAITDTISALREFAAHQQVKGIAIAPPRTVQEVMRDKEAAYSPETGEAIVMVPLILDQARPVKANISLDAGLLEAIDEEAARRGLTRSALLTRAAVEKIGKPESPRMDAAIAALRAELAATHERLARQAAHFTLEMRRLGGKAEARKRNDMPRGSGRHRPGRASQKGRDRDKSKAT
jgi:predicted RNase H-like HicB family nuclease